MKAASVRATPEPTASPRSPSGGVVLAFLLAQSACSRSVEVEAASTMEPPIDVAATASDGGEDVIASFAVGTPPAERALSIDDAVAEGGARELGPWALTLDYGPCFGACTPYQLSLRADGTFHGGLHPRRLAAAQTAVVATALQALLDKPPRCAAGPTCVQYVTVSFQAGGRRRSFRHPSGHTCNSAALVNLERLMQRLADGRD